MLSHLMRILRTIDQCSISLPTTIPSMSQNLAITNTQTNNTSSITKCPNLDTNHTQPKFLEQSLLLLFPKLFQSLLLILRLRANPFSHDKIQLHHTMIRPRTMV